MKHIFINSGTDYTPIIEALAEISAEGKEAIEPIVVPHEGPAVGMALGYYMIRGEPQAVMVHTTPGTANSLANIMNAQSMNIPLFLIAGRTPVTEKGVFGGKVIPVHWNQELRDQSEMLRQFTKWDWEHRFGEQLEKELVRAYEVAMSDPKGPVYLTLPRERISENMEEISRISEPRPVEPTVPEMETVRKIARQLTESERPIVLTSQLARNPDAPGELVSLAENMALPVSQNFYYLNFPTDHDLYVGRMGGKLSNQYLTAADFVLMIDVDVPWTPHTVEPSGDARIVHIDIDPLKLRMPTWGFRSDVRMSGNSELVLKLLISETNQLIKENPEINSRLEERRKRITRDHESLVKQAREEAFRHKDEEPIDPRWLSYCIGSIIDDNKLLFTETVRSPFYEYAPLKKPGMAFSTPPFGALGWSMGAALGAKLASPESDVLVLLGDGSYMYNSPVACHFVSKARKLPIMTVIYNNQTWYASKEPVAKMYPKGAAVRTNNFPGTDLSPSPKFEFVAKSSGALAREITDPDEVLPAIRESLEYMHDKENQVLLNIILKRSL